MLYNALKPGGYFYFEDYVMANEYPEQMEPEYKEIFTKKFPMVSVKTESDLIALL